MVFVTGRVYLEYLTDEETTSLRLLETTMVGSTTSDFIDATNYQVVDFNASLDEFSDSDFLDVYFVIDVENAREIIKPIGR